MLLAAIAVSLAAAGTTGNAGAAVPQGNLGAARGYAVIDAGDGEQLDFRAPDLRASIAGATKLMTAYVALKDLPPNRTNRDLLYELILRDSDDAANRLARAAAGSEASFVAQMNRYAKALGLADTHFANPSGLDQPGNYSTAHDLAELARRLLRIPAFAKIADSRHATLLSARPRRRISSLNRLIFIAPWANGVNVGHTHGAKYVLVASGRQRGVELIVAVIGANSSEESYGDALDLLDYVFSFYHQKQVIYTHETLAEPSIRYSGGKLPLSTTRGLTVPTRAGQGAAVLVHAPDEVEGPISSGTALGRAVVRVGGREVASVPLRAAEGVSKASAWDRARSFVEENLGWIVLALVGILGGAWLARRRLRASHV